MKKRILALAVFSLSFALVEAVVVVYLRQIFPSALSLGPWLLRVEQVREAATIIMLLSLAYIWGRTFRERILAFVFAFSIWDLGYYFFLNRILGWPKSLWDIDVFFLIPVPWLGPVILPVVIFGVLLLISFRLILKNSKKI